MPDKMTDNEIVKAFEEHLLDNRDCELCPYGPAKYMCDMKLLKDVLDLINSQKAEIEKQKKKVELRNLIISKLKTGSNAYISLMGDSLGYLEIKAEAYKECIEKVKERLAVHSFTSNSTEYTDGMLDCMEWVDSKIEELKKELVGEDK